MGITKLLIGFQASIGCCFYEELWQSDNYARARLFDEHLPVRPGALPVYYWSRQGYTGEFECGFTYEQPEPGSLAIARPRMVHNTNFRFDE